MIAIETEQEQLRFGLTAACIADIQRVLAYSPKLEKAVLFGSRAIGTYKNGSDIDLVLQGEKLVYDDIITLYGQLDELPYAYTYDLIDYNKISNPAVKAHIDDLGIVFYEKEQSHLPTGWKEYTLGELGVLARGKSKHRPRDAAFLYGGEYPFIQTGDIKAANHKIITHNQTYSEAGLKQSKLWPVGTICITIAANIADTAILTYPACFPDSVIGFVADQTKCNIDFVEYLLRYTKRNIQSHAIGSVQDNINLGTFEKITLALPPLETQIEIASILSAFDDKIELNRQMNQTLESIAQTLFTEWFVRFNFPSFDGELVDGLPKGWRVGTLGEVGLTVTGKTPSSSMPEHFGDRIPFITPTDFKNYDKIIISADRHLSTQGSEFFIKKMLPKNSVLVTCIGSDMGKVAMNRIVCATNQQINSIIVDFNIVSADYVYYDLLSKYELLKNMATGGSTMPIINKSQFEGIPIIIPSIGLIHDFQAILNFINGKLESNIRQNQTLTLLRDSLLPKLMSGQIRVGPNA